MTASDRQLLAFEEEHAEPGPAKASAIRAELGMSAARYQQRILRLSKTAEALAEYPVLVHRIERQRMASALRRADKRLA